MNEALKALSKRIPELRGDDGDDARRGRVARAHDDFAFFCSTYLGRYFSCEMAPYQRLLVRIAQERSLPEDALDELRGYVPEDFQGTLAPMAHLKGMADVEPRGHGKSTRWTFAFPLWLALTGRSRFVVITGAEKGSAVAQMGAMKQELEQNDLLIQDYGDQVGGTWKADEILLRNGARIRAFGKAGSMRGAKNREARPDYVIVDDVFKDQEAESPALREKVDSWFKKTVLPIGQPETFFVMVNTITHNDDLISRVLKRIGDGDMPGWIGIRLAAELGEGRPLWPQRYSWRYLKDMETSIGSVAYAQEYMSRALSDEDRLFRKEWIRVVADAEVPRRLARYEGIDPATGAHDLSAVVDIGYSKEEGRIYVVASDGHKESTERFKQRLISRYLHYRYRKAGMEAVAFQNVYRQEIVRDAAKRGLSLPLKAMNPGRGSKVQRDMMLSPLIENGTIVFCQGNDMLIDQLLEFPTGRYDDLVDALYYAVKVSGMKGVDFYDDEPDGDGADALARMRRMLNI